MNRTRPQSGFTAVALLLGVAAALACGRDTGEPPRPPIVLITLDTTRADRLSCYGYSRPTSPNLDRLCADATVYTRAYSTSSWTLPAHASLFTGEPVSQHGVRFDPDGPLVIGSEIHDDPVGHLFRARGLPAGATTLASTLRDAGYRTSAFVGGPWMKRVFGLASGFETYDDEGIRKLAGRAADPITTRALAWLDEPRDDPFFLFLNYYDPHEPYVAPDAFSHAFLPEPPGVSPTRREASGLYDGQILYMDHHVGRLLEGLRTRGLYDPAWIIVTADHGEALGEHGHVGHAQTLYEEEIRVPLVIKYPAGYPAAAKLAADAPVQLTHVLPMLANALRLDGGGESTPPAAALVVAELYPLAGLQQGGDWRALVDGNDKLMWNSEGRHQLFDLAADPREQRNLARLEPERVARMIARLEQIRAQSPPRPTAPGEDIIVDGETVETLKALGYVGESESP